MCSTTGGIGRRGEGGAGLPAGVCVCVAQNAERVPPKGNCDGGDGSGRISVTKKCLQLNKAWVRWHNS